MLTGGYQQVNAQLQQQQPQHSYQHQHVDRQIVHNQNAGAPAYASSATKELDDLMASLSDFKVSEDNLWYL